MDAWDRKAVAASPSARAARILFPFEGGLAGGSHMSALTLVERLDRHQFEPVILLHRAEGTLVEELGRRGLAWQAAGPDIAPVGRADLALRALSRARWLRRNDIDLVHTNEGLMHVAWSVAARIATVPSLWHHRANPDARGLRFVAPWTATQIVSVSHFSLPRNHRLVKQGRADVVRSPFAVTMVGSETRDDVRRHLCELGVDRDALVVGFFGHYAARKRPILFLEALALARRNLDRPIAGLMFGLPFDAGSGEAVKARIVELGLSGIVREMGFERPIEPWMAACDINLVTAVEEPFGRTLVESMLLGTGLIAARSGGNVEAIRHGETGLLVEPDDARAFADAIVRLSNPQFRSSLAAAAQSDACHRYGIEEHVRQISQIYARLLPGLVVPFATPNAHPRQKAPIASDPAMP